MLGFFVKLVSGWKLLTSATKSSILAVTMVLDTSQCFITKPSSATWIHITEYEERVRKFSFLARHHFKSELYRFIYIVIFGKHLSELYWIVLMCFYIFSALLARRTFNIKSWTVQSSSPSCPYIQVGQERGGRNYENCL